MRSAWLVLGAAMLVAACGGSLGGAIEGSVGDQDWMLEGVDPDDRHLLVSTSFGGVAADCARFEGWEVAESAEGVDVRARLWRRRAPSGCTDEATVELLQIDLDEPLGDRPLTGCGEDDCRATVARGGELAVGPVVVAGGIVGVVGAEGIEAWDSSGDPAATVAGFGGGTVPAIGEGTVAVNDDRGDVVAIDLATGEEVWRSTGWLRSAADGMVLVCRGDDADGLSAVDTVTGDDLWTTDLVCGDVVRHGDLLTIIGHDPAVDGGHRLVVVDAATGEVRSDEPIDDGVDDRVNGFDRAVAVGSTTVLGGFQADLVVLDADGAELARPATGLGLLLGAAEGVVVIAGRDEVVGYDPGAPTGSAGPAVRWTLDGDPFATLAVADGSVWTLDRAAGTVSRLAPDTGRPRWTVDVGPTSAFAAAASADTAYLVTTQALAAVDLDSGDLRWSRHRPHEPAG